MNWNKKNISATTGDKLLKKVCSKEDKLFEVQKLESIGFKARKRLDAWWIEEYPCHPKR